LFYNFTLLWFFFSIKFNPNYFDCQFFCFDKFLKLLFLNWFIINFLIEPRSRVVWVASFKDLTRFRMFFQVCLVFFSFSKLIFFLFYPIVFIQLKIGFLFFFYLAFYVDFFAGLKKYLIILGVFVYHSLLGFSFKFCSHYFQCYFFIWYNFFNLIFSLEFSTNFNNDPNFLGFF
jgi:hypothetical protein